MNRLAITLAVLAGLAPAARATTQVHYVMGTFLRVTVDGDAPLWAFDACFGRARELDRTFSRFDPGSELARLNADGQGAASAGFREALARAMALRAATDGAFDVSAGAVTALWRAPERPSPAAIEAARRTVGAVSIDGERVILGAGTRLDFDGFAKGVAVDACVAALRAAGITRALVSFGESSLFALGAPRGTAGWTLSVRGPEPDRVMARLRLRDGGAAVSAAFGGRGRTGVQATAHIVDPAAGAAIRDDAAAVVVADSAASAEAFAKAALVRGPGALAALERRAPARIAWLDRSRIAMGPEMRRSGALRPIAGSTAEANP